MELDGGGDVEAGAPESEVATAAESPGVSGPATDVGPCRGSEPVTAVPSEGAATSSCAPQVRENPAKEDDGDGDSWITPKRKKGRRSPPPSMPAKIVEVGHSELDDIGFLSA